MIERIPRRGQQDCVICTVAMVMRPPFDYERVLLDSRRYPQITAEGKYSAWWETYLRDEKFETCYCRFDGLSALWQYWGKVVGILGMDIPHLASGHLVAVDELGVVDPSTGAPPHVPLQEYIPSRLLDGEI